MVESDRLDLRELTDLHKWVIIPRLKQVTGVADVNVITAVSLPNIRSR